MPNGHTIEQRAHEHSDVSIGLLVRYIVAIVVGAALLLGGLGLYWRFLSQVDPQQPSVSRWTGPRQLPPAPRLQVAPETDLQYYLKQQREQLQSYGWADSAAGAVRIPIDRAIDLLAQRGLPARAQPGEQRSSRGPNQP